MSDSRKRFAAIYAVASARSELSHAGGEEAHALYVFHRLRRWKQGRRLTPQGMQVTVFTAAEPDFHCQMGNPELAFRGVTEWLQQCDA